MSNIYFIRSGNDGPIKIGRARDVARRVRTLQTASAAPLVLLGVIPGDGKVERRLHRRFAANRIRGEWFRATPELLAHIDALTRPPAAEPLTPERARELRNVLAALSKAPGDFQALLMPRTAPGQEVL
jgi:hypothetical protein